MFQPPFCFPLLPLFLWFRVFYFPRQPNEGESSVSTTYSSCPKAPSLRIKPSHTLLKTPGASQFHGTLRHDTLCFYSVPHSHTLTTSRSLSQSIHFFSQYLKLSASVPQTQTYNFLVSHIVLNPQL